MGYRLSWSDNAEYPTGKMLIFFAGYGITQKLTDLEYSDPPNS